MEYFKNIYKMFENRKRNLRKNLNLRTTYIKNIKIFLLISVLYCLMDKNNYFKIIT